MRIAYFDCFAGISGDMAVAALIAAGASLEGIREGLKKCPLVPADVQVVTEEIVRSALSALKFNVVDHHGLPIDRIPAVAAAAIAGAERSDYGHNHDDGSGHSHHDHSHGDHHHDHDHDHTHAHHPHHHDHSHGDHQHGHDHSHGHHGHQHGHTHSHVTFRMIREGLLSSELSDRVKEISIDIFAAIARGEGAVHGCPPEDVHFHEVGAVDSIVDIVSVALCLEQLEIDAIFSSPVSLGGGGMIRTQHGLMPIPAPATVEILRGHAVALTTIPFELTTPTGAGIIAALSRGNLGDRELRPIATGFGGGTRDLAERPNLLRVVIAELQESTPSDVDQDVVLLIESNVDDMSPEAWPLVTERILEAGALDVWLTPVQMKKGRPGIVLSLLAPSELLDSIIGVIARETSTIGVRYREVTRGKLKRERVTRMTRFGPVECKMVQRPDRVEIIPEAEELNRIARHSGMSFMEVSDSVRADIARHHS